MLGALALVVLAAPPAYADVPHFGDPTAVCTVGDERIDEGSGMVVTTAGWDVIDDGGSEVVVYHLDRSCVVTGTTTASIDPYDTEDLTLGPDGRLWVGDIGDNDEKRATVAVEVLPATPGDVTGSAVLRRFTYPDGPHDAEALLVERSGRVVVVTKELLGTSGIYATPGPVSLDGPDPGPVRLARSGVLQLDVTGTEGGPVGGLGNLLVTGAAAAPDGSLVALRTYTDLYVWAVPAGRTLLDTLVQDPPTRQALPPQPQGEAVAIGPDRTLYLFGEGIGQAILALPWQPQPAPAASSSAPAGSAAASGASGPTTDDDAEAVEAPDHPDTAGDRRTLVALTAAAVVALLGVVLVLRRSGRRADRRTGD